MKGRVLSIVIVVIIASFFVAPVASQGGDEHRQTGVVQVDLYAQLDTTDSTLTTEQSSQNFRITDAITFTSVQLYENLEVQGVETELHLNKGLVARIGVSAQVQDARVTVRVLDDDDAVANRTLTVPRGETRWDWRLPFTTDRDSYTFSKRHSIGLEINADRNVVMRTDTDSYLRLRCLDHLDIDVHTEDVDEERSTSFYPNDLPNLRHILFRGFVYNPFGGADVDRVNVTIKRPNGSTEVDEHMAEITFTTTVINYTFDWHYNTELPPGVYRIEVTGTDLQGHEFTTTGSFDMENYGVKITAEDEENGKVEGETTPGTLEPYSITVDNIGGKTAHIELDEGAAVSLWETSWSQTSLTLGPGDDDDVTLDVKPSATLGGGNQSRYVVTATITDDPKVPKAHDSLEVITTVVNEVGFSIFPENPAAKTVGVRGTVDHTVTLQNIGEMTTDVDLLLNSPPSGWSAELRVDGVTTNTIDDLRPREYEEITLRMTAPSTSTTNKATMTLKCQAHLYPDIYKEVTLVTNLVVGLELRPVPPLDFTLDPGGSASIIFDMWNPDPTRSHNITFSVEQLDSAWPEYTSFVFSDTTPELDPNPQGTNPDDNTLQITVPETAEADDYAFTVVGIVDGNKDVRVRFDFDIEIKIVRSWDVEIQNKPSRIIVSPEEFSYIYVDVINSGNVLEELNFTVDFESDDLIVEINDLPGSARQLLLSPGYEITLKVGFKARDTAKHKDEITVRISVTSEDDPSNEYRDDFTALVEKPPSQVFLEFAMVFLPMILIVASMAILMVYNPRRRRPEAMKPEEEERKEKDAGGAFARQ